MKCRLRHSHGQICTQWTCRGVYIPTILVDLGIDHLSL